MAIHSSVLAWRIPGTGEPSGPPSMGSHRVGHDRSDLAADLPNPDKLPISFYSSFIKYLICKVHIIHSVLHMKKLKLREVLSFAHSTFAQVNNIHRYKLGYSPRLFNCNKHQPEDLEASFRGQCSSLKSI